MLIPDSVRCTFCRRGFCCENCRVRHESICETRAQLVEQKAQQKFSCSICEGKPSISVRFDNPDLIEHLVREHLPLKCNKCGKYFTDLSHFEPANAEECSNRLKLMKRSARENKENMEPILEVIPEKRRSFGNEITKQVTPNNYYSSLQSSSTIDHSSQLMVNKTQSPKGKLVRSTSTPMQPPSFFDLKRPVASFDSMSSANMSSIISRTTHINSSDSDVSTSNCITSPGTSFVIQKKTITKTKTRVKMPGVGATPLRQVMSKSIQRAIVQHGLQNYPNARPTLHFDSLSSNSDNDITSPLDLRTTPAIRRSSNLISTNHESVVVDENENSETKYITCNPFDGQNPENELMTPKYVTSNPSGLLKKAISFTSPPVDTPEIYVATAHTTKTEIWYTPEAALPVRSLSCSAMEMKRKFLSATTHNKNKPIVVPPAEVDDDDEVFLPKISIEETNNDENNIRVDEEANIEESDENGNRNAPPNDNGGSGDGGGRKRIWSFVSSMLRIASFSGGRTSSNNSDNNNENVEPNLIKRYASFSGWKNPLLRRDSSVVVEDHQPFSKRRKTNCGVYFNDDTSRESIDTSDDSLDSFRRKRIRGRQPIDRMRKDL